MWTFYMKEVLDKINEKLKHDYFKGRSNLFTPPALTKCYNTTSHDMDSILKHDWLWPTIGHLLREGDIVIAEAGTSSCRT